MNAYTISKLAEDAGVSIHIVRNYEQRGLLQPCKCTECGYRIYDENALERLRFILAGKEAGVSLDELTAFFKTLDNGDRAAVRQCLMQMEKKLAYRFENLSRFKRALNAIKNAGLNVNARALAAGSPLNP